MARKSRRQEQQRFLQPSAAEIVSKNATVYRTGVYARLSRPNLKDTQVDVLASQLHHLQEYVSCHADMELIDTYVDDGWSGLNFNRPDFTRMMEDVKSGKINCIVVRDFSRFGRNYLETGYYLLEIFPACEVRFISIFDEFDSLTSDANSMIFSMMQIVNDFYSKDISRKICSVYDEKVSKGFCWGNIPNGYLRRKDGTGRLLMDEQIAPAIYLAYYWLNRGVKYAQVARNLNMLGLSHHSPSSNQEDRTNLPWTNFHILLLTQNPLYTGDHAYNRSRNRKYDSSHLGPQPMEAWKYVPNTHPGYISRETYLRFCDRREIRGKTLSEGKRRRAETVDQVQNPFRYLLFCGECQYALVPEKDADGNASEYVCTGQHRIQAVGHLGYSITRTRVMALVIQELQTEQAELRLLHQTLQALPTDSVCTAMEEAKRRILSDLSQQAEATAGKIIRAQKDFKHGLLEPDIYHLQIEKLEMEKAIIQGSSAELQQQIDELRLVLSPGQQWLCRFAALTIADEVPSSLLHQLIQRIDVFADQHITVAYTHTEEKQKLIACLNEWEQLQKEAAHG